ncbi:MAG: aldolase/citrate lyase family protein, partial [Opitutales bacterium]|nr:aldolase/citrate lyase family protein [Opitutales bacterium]
MEDLKKRIERNEVVLGTFMKITDPAAVEIAGLAGFKFLILDQEHGPVSVESLQNLIRACQIVGVCPIVRVPRNEESDILRALDVGAMGIEVPQIRTSEDAVRVARATRFHPQGERGACRYVRAAGYSSVPKEDHFTKSNHRILTIGHIEGLEGIDNLEDICRSGGLDVVFIGPYDLSQSCGVPGKVDDARVVAHMRSAVEIARSHGVSVGTFVESVESANRWKCLGVQFLAYGVDVGI